jgi:hypothetical protein
MFVATLITSGMVIEVQIGSSAANVCRNTAVQRLHGDGCFFQVSKEHLRYSPWLKETLTGMERRVCFLVQVCVRWMSSVFVLDEID